METSTPKNQRFKFNLKLVLQIIFPLLLLTIIPLQLAKNISFKRSQKQVITTTPNSYINVNNDNDDNDNDNDNQEVGSPPKHGSLPPTTRKCDIFSGEWVPNPEAPYYTNTSCWAIHEHQNCMKYGRPDSEFMKWRWKPDECELPLFNPRQFFEIMRGKSLAFVGDSVARNQMQSLICLLSRVEYPYDVSDSSDEHFKRWHYNNYNFTVAIFTTPFLVKSQENDPNGPTGTGIFGLFLDEADEGWKSKIDEFDYIVVSAGHWFFRPLMFYENQNLIGCRFCQIPNVTDYSMAYGYRKAFRTVFETILERENFKGVMYLRTYAPSHFEGGEWNKGGNCLRQKPFKSSQISLEGINLELYMAQLGEFKKAQKKARERGMKFRLIDLTQPILMRPDGHPSRYGHGPEEKVTLYNDCVHWCLPGPIDSWNDFLLEMLRSEGVLSKEDKKALHSSERKLKSKK